MNTTTKTAKSAAISKAIAQRKAASVFAILMGISIIGFIGFSHIEVVHNAAHDTRHSFAFPCH